MRFKGDSLDTGHITKVDHLQKKSTIALFCSCLYLIIEYMRPQESYDFIFAWPLGLISLIFVVLSFFAEHRTFHDTTRQDRLILAYLAWFAISCMLSYRPDLAWQGLSDFAKLVVIYFLLSNILTDRRALYVFLILFLLLNFKFAQYAVRAWAANGFYSDPRGLFAGGGIGSSFFKNPNDFGAAMNSALGLSYTMIFVDKHKLFGWLRIKWFHVASAFSMILAILASSSRGAALGAGAVAFGALMKSRRKLGGLIALGSIVILFLALIPADNWNRFQQIGSEGDSTSQSRIRLLKAGFQMANSHPFFGVGPNNFRHVNEFVLRNDLKEVQHNIYMQSLSELGYPGLLILISLIIFSFISRYRDRQTLKMHGNTNGELLVGISHGIDLCMIGFLANGLFITVLYYPFFWMLLILSAALQQVIKNETASQGGING